MNKPIKTNDLGTINPENSSANFSSEYNKIWFDERYCDIKSNPLTKTILRLYLGMNNKVFYSNILHISD
jgi:hypothetical protein